MRNELLMRARTRGFFVTACCAFVLIAATAGCTVTIPAPVDSSPASPVLEGRQLNTVILGDSFAAGRGDGPYNPGVIDFCTQSPQSWGEKLVRKLHETDHVTGSLVNMSCNGDTTYDVLSYQLRAVDAQTDLVLLQIGGNDIGIDQIFLSCFLGCDTAAELRSAQRRLPGIFKRLGRIIDSIHTVAPNATVLVTDYPDLVGDPATWNDGKCLGFITPEMGTALRSMVADGSRMYASLTRNFNVTFVSERAVIAGHNWCDTDASWISGLTHYESDGRRRDLWSIFAFHPLDQAHQAIATEARQQLIRYFGE